MPEDLGIMTAHGSPGSPIDRARLASYIQRLGLTVMRARTGLERRTMGSFIAGLPVLHSTALAVKVALDRLDAEAQRAADAARIARESGGRHE